MIPSLHVHLLGKFQLLLDEAVVTTVDWARLQSLLAYLMLHRNAPQSRTHLAFLFWPDSTEAQAHTNLRHLVYRLRHALPHADHFLRIEKQTLQWQPDTLWTLDVIDFETAIIEAEQVSNQDALRSALERAANLYHGDLLQDCYDEWILAERERLRSLFLDALEHLILLLEQERDYVAAIRTAQRLLSHDPLHEATYRHLMRLYATHGERAAALRTYHRCVTMLERELATEPSHATHETYELLMRQDIPSAHSTVSIPIVATASLVGRRQEWMQFQKVWQTALASRASMLLLSGEVGIGKTRLAEELLAWVARQGTTTAVAKCYPAEGELAYAPITAWLRADAIQSTLTVLADPWLTEVARFVPEVLLKRPDLHPAPLQESWQRQRLFEALAHAILGARQPLFLLLDDIQWCDRETLEWLHFLLRFDSHAHMLLVATVRPEEVGEEHPLKPLLASLRQSGQITEVSLEPLNAIETASLAAHVTEQDLAPNMVAELYRETEGNPLFVVETLRANPEGTRLIERQSSDAPAINFRLPQTIQAVIATRLEQLSPLARKLVSLAATIGRAFTFQVLAHASQQDEDTLVRALDELWQRRIVREQSAGSADAYDFSHDKLREVAYSALSTVGRHILHRRVAEALESVYANSLETVCGQIAVHYEHAGLVEQAIMYYQRSAEESKKVYVHAEALAAYARALALLEKPFPESRQGWRQQFVATLHEQMGDVLAFVGQPAEARSSYEYAIALASEEQRIWRALLESKVARTMEAQHRYQEALYDYERAEASLGSPSVEATPEWWQNWIDIQSGRVMVHYWLARPQEIGELVEKVRPIVERYGTARQRARFFHHLVSMGLRQARFIASEEMLAFARAEMAASQESQDTREIAQAQFGLGFCHLWHDDLDEAEEHLQAALSFGERTGNATLQVRCLAYVLMVYRKRRQVQATQHYSSRLMEMATRLQLPEYIALSKANLAWVAWREGQLDKVQLQSRVALELWHQQPTAAMCYPIEWTALWPLIYVELTQGLTAIAIEDAHRLLAPMQQPLPDTLMDIIEEAFQAWNASQVEKAHTELQQATALAQEMGYL